MIIGVAGTHGSGKDTLAAYLVSKGFVHYSHSDVLREDLRERGIEVIRDNLQRYGNDLRAKEGHDILARRIQKKLVPGKNYVISSIRNAAEVDSWKKMKGFVLVWVDAPADIRFKRSTSREGRNLTESKNEQTMESFLAIEKKEWDNDDPNKQQLKRCKEMASKTIINDSTLENFHKKIASLLKGV